MALVNLGLYEPARAIMCKCHLVSHHLPHLLQGNEVQQELALALLQNATLYWPCHPDVLQCGFLPQAQHFVLGAPRWRSTLREHAPADTSRQSRVRAPAVLPRAR